MGLVSLFLFISFDSFFLDLFLNEFSSLLAFDLFDLAVFLLLIVRFYLFILAVQGLDDLFFFDIRLDLFLSGRIIGFLPLAFLEFSGREIDALLVEFPYGRKIRLLVQQITGSVFFVSSGPSGSVHVELQLLRQAHGYDMRNAVDIDTS